MSNIIFIRQYGLQRSGTNIVKALCEVNFKSVYVVSEIAGNKHDPMSWDILEGNLRNLSPDESSFPEEYIEALASNVAERSLSFIFNLKDPVSWLESYYRYQCKKFNYRNPGKTFPFSRQFAEESLASWQVRIDSWIPFVQGNPDQCYVIQHERLLDNSRLILGEIEAQFGLERQGRFLQQIDGHALRGTESQHGASLIHPKQKVDKDYHLSGRWANGIPAEYAKLAMSVFCDAKSKWPILERFISSSHLPGKFVSG